MSRIRSFATTELLMLGGLLVFVAGCFGVENLLELNAPIQLGPVSALLFATLPAALWLGYFHSQDRLEPEPRHYVAGAFAAGAFVAGPAASFLIGLATRQTPSGLHLQAMGLDRWVYALAIVGIAQETSKYVVIRYTLYLSDEFDEPLDGIIYMSAAGLGFASYQSYNALIADDGAIFLSAGAVHVVITTLAHASFAAILGFAMGHAKFARGRLGRGTKLASGLIVAAAASGCFRMAMDAARTSGLEIASFRPLLVGVAFSGAIFAVVSLLVRRLAAISPHGEGASDA